MGREDPIEFDIYLALFFVVCFLVYKLGECFVGVMGGNFFNSSLLLYIYLYFI